MQKVVTANFPMKKFLILMVAGLMTFNSGAAEAPDQPLQVLYLGPVDVGGGGGGRGNSRTNYVYLPGQTLAP
jgi:hypothetical protein